MIDSATTLFLVGAALQAVPPAGAFVATIRRRPNARELQRCLEYTPLPRRDRALEQLVIIADTAFRD